MSNPSQELGTGHEEVSAPSVPPGAESPPNTSGKPKRHRLAASCDRCKRRKIKCDTLEPRCTPCATNNVDCLSSDGRKRRKTGQGQPSKETEKTMSSEARGQSSSSAVDADMYQPFTTQSSEPQASGSGLHDDGMFQLSQSMTSSADALLQLGTFASTSQSHAGHNYQSIPPRPEMQRYASQSLSTSYDPGGTSYSMVQSSMGSTASERQSLNAGSELLSPQDNVQLHHKFNEVGLVHTSQHRSKFLGASANQIFLKWLDQDSASTAKLSEHLGHAMSDAEEFVWPDLDPSWAPLPARAELNMYLDAYFRYCHPTFPCLDETTVRAAVANLSVHSMPDGDCIMPLLYLVVSIGADSNGQRPRMSSTGQSYLRLAWKALPSLLARPYRTTVQALILLALAFRVRNREGVSWNIIGYAVRIAHGLGLHLEQPPSPQAVLDARIWFSVYCLDKVHSFDSGRLSAIQDSECTVKPASSLYSSSSSTPVQDVNSQTASLSQPDLRAFGSLVSLSQHISTVNTRLFSSNVRSSIDALVRLCECDQALVRWVEEQPSDIRPNVTPPSDPSYFGASLVGMLYNQLLITLHRISLFVDVSKVQDARLQPYLPRLRASKTVCANAARSLLDILDTFASQPPNCPYWTLHPALTAVFALSIHTYKQAANWKARSDIVLIQHACDFIETSYKESDFHPDFVKLLPAISKKVSARVHNPHLPSRGPTRVGTPEANQGQGDQDPFSQSAPDFWQMLNFNQPHNWDATNSVMDASALDSIIQEFYGSRLP